MKNWWIRFGCFLIGYNYNIIRNCSEISAKAVKRYTAAVLIVCILWSFIGFKFTNQYLQQGILGSALGAIVFVVIIIQIERQIILTITKNKILLFFRGVLAILMALIGSIIIDQIIFKDDIALEKITSIEQRVKKALPPKTEELRSQITLLEAAISKKEFERSTLIADIAKNPTSVIYSNQPAVRTEKRTTIDTLSGKPVTSEKSLPIMVTSSSNVSNPKISFIAPLEENITDLRNLKLEKENSLLNIRPQIEKEIRSKVGFLDELEIMVTLLSNSKVALIVYIIWFLFLFSLELLVLSTKFGPQEENDYEKTVKHHMSLQNKKLDLYLKMAQENG
jgi:hypothetical protein